MKQTKIKMWQVQALGLLLLSLASICRGANDCCPGGTAWQNSSMCSDGNKIKLVCPNGLFLLEPESNPDSDNFTIENGELLLSENSEPIPPHRFCVAKSRENPNADVALICFDVVVPEWRTTVFSVLSFISAFFLIITMVVYIVLPELRDIQGKALMGAVASLTGGYIILAVVQAGLLELFHSINACITLAFILYYCFISAFFWLNVVAFNVWRTVWFQNFMLRDNTLFLIFCVIGWGCPACFLIASLTTHHTDGYHLKPGFGDESCWFAGSKQTWAYFYGPIAFLLTLNLIYFGLTCWKLWHQYRDYSGSKLRVLRFKCMLYLKLLLVMGVTWIFEVLSFASGVSTRDYWIITDILNSLQGVIIFVLLIATRKRVRKLLAKKRPCGINFPKSWVAGEDEECEIVLPEEAELSQTT